MSNTYFKIEKHKEYKSEYPSYSNSYGLALTAFVGGEDIVQLTVNTVSSIQGQSGTGYIVLSSKDIDLLIAGLLERKLGKISATGDEQSIFSPNERREES